MTKKRVILMKIAVVSMPVVPGKCMDNFKTMKKYIQQAKEAAADLIVFPQNALTAYPLGDLWLDREFCIYADSFNDQISALADDLAIVWGNVRYRGGKCFNTAFFASRDGVEIRVKGFDGNLCNDPRYFDKIGGGELIEYKGEYIALNFHDELQMATMNITLDASRYSILPKGATQVYVNAGGIWQDTDGMHLFDGRCFVTKGRTVIHFSEYENGLFICESEGSKMIAKTDQKKRLAYLLNEMKKSKKKYAFAANDCFSRRIIEQYDCTWMLKEGEKEVSLRSIGWDVQNDPVLLCDFDPLQLMEVGVIESADELSVDQLIIAFYEQTHSIKGVCSRLIAFSSFSRNIRDKMRDPNTFVHEIAMVLFRYQKKRYDHEMEHSYIEREIETGIKCLNESEAVRISE